MVRDLLNLSEKMWQCCYELLWWGGHRRLRHFIGIGSTLIFYLSPPPLPTGLCSSIAHLFITSLSNSSLNTSLHVFSLLFSILIRWKHIQTKLLNMIIIFNWFAVAPYMMLHTLIQSLMSKWYRNNFTLACEGEQKLSDQTSYYWTLHSSSITTYCISFEQKIFFKKSWHLN